MRVVVMPANFVSAGWGTPTVCARHGEPATEHRKVSFRSLVPGWVYLFLVFSPLIAVLAALLVRRRVRAGAWPFCPGCAALHAKRRKILLGILGLAAALILVALVMVDTSDGAMGIGLAVIILLIVAAFTATRSRAGWIAAGYATADARAVEFRNPAPAFVEQVAAAKKAAADHYAEQPAPTA